MKQIAEFNCKVRQMLKAGEIPANVSDLLLDLNAMLFYMQRRLSSVEGTQKAERS